MYLLAVVFIFLVPSSTDAATDEFSYDIISGKATVNCAFKFVYKLGSSRIDLRRSTVECFDLPRTIKVKDYSVSSECGSVFSISMTVTKVKATLTAGTISAPSSGCKPEPLTTEKPKPKRRCPYGYTYICPSFEDGSCLPRQVSVCFKQRKGQSSDSNEEGQTQVEMRTPDVAVTRTRMVSKPTKEERAEVIASCMCIPNMALYAGALVPMKPESGPEEGQLEGSERHLEMERNVGAEDMDRNVGAEDMDRNVEAAGRATCSEKFKKNFKSGKWLVKCTWTLVYTDTKVDLTKSKATCSSAASAVLRPKNVAISTTCGSVITMSLTVTSRKATITKGDVTRVGKSCKCYVAPTTASATTTSTTTTTTTTTTTSTTATTTSTTTSTTTTARINVGTTGEPNVGGVPAQKNIFSPRFMSECACIEQGAIKKGPLRKGK